MSRPHYREGQPLRAADLTDEQDYQLAAAARHLRLQHGPGVAGGLRIGASPAGVRVGAGLAVDAEGRALALVRPSLLRTADLPAAAAALDLWLRHTSVTAGSRVLDGAAPLVVEPDPAEPPAGPTGAVFLGRLLARPGEQPPFVPDPAFPPSPVSLTGETVTGPGHTRLRLGSAAGGAVAAVDVVGPDGVPAQRVRLDRRGSAVSGDTAVSGPATAEAVRVTATTPADDDPEPRPWRLYRHGAELRLELGTPGGAVAPDGVAWTVGVPGAAVPVITADATGSVRIRGELIAPGGTILAPAKASRTDTRFTQALSDAWIDAFAATADRVQERFGGPRFDTASLGLQVLVGTDDPVAGQTFGWRARLTNVGGLPVNNARIVASVRIGGVPAAVTPVVGLSLAPGNFLVVQQSVAVPATAGGQQFVLTVVALGLLPGTRVTWTVSSPVVRTVDA